jgi:hypothetical protein
MANLNFSDDGAQRALSRLPRATLDQLMRYVGGEQAIVKAEPYYSMLRIEWTIAGAVWTLPQFRWQAFQYGRSDSMAAAGFITNARNASSLETNLQSKGETNGGEVMLIKQIGLVLHPVQDAYLVAQTLGDVVITAGFGGEADSFKLGPAIFYPGGSGLAGGGTSPLIAPNLGDGQAVIPGFPSLGMPLSGNGRELDETLAWFPKGAGTGEQNFSVSLSTPRSKSFTAPTARTATTGIAASTPPAATGAAGSYVDLWVRLDGYQLAPRAQNR